MVKYPVIQFTSQKIVKAGNSYQVTGNLAMHGVTKPLTIPFTFQKTGTGGVFAGTFTINRNDFKVGKAGGDVAESIKLDVSVPVTK